MKYNLIILSFLTSSLFLEAKDTIIDDKKNVYSSNSELSAKEKESNPKENQKKVYFKLTYGNSLLEMYSEGKSQKFHGNTLNYNFNHSIKKTNNYIGLNIKLFENNNLNNSSYGINYSYLFFLENKSFFSFSLFLGQGRFTHDNQPGKIYLSPNNFVLGKFVYDNNYRSFGSFVGGIVLHPKQYNFIEITPSISFEIPIFDESGFNLAFEIFASRKKISNRNKNEFFDTIYLNSNEVGFRFGITKLN